MALFVNLAFSCLFVETQVSEVQGVPVCEWGKYGHNCDRLSSDQCRLHPVRNLRPCQKYTGKCSEGCVSGRHGDLCDQLCSPNCINNWCFQLNGECIFGCIEGYIGYFCNITTGTQIQTTGAQIATTDPIAQSDIICDMGKYGQNCDLPCSEDCGLFPKRNLPSCHKDTGTCLYGCVRGRHGDHCDQLCSQNCIKTICNQPNGGCTIGCIDGYVGHFCDTTGTQIQTRGTQIQTTGTQIQTTGTQIQTTVSTVQDDILCDIGKYGQNCDRPCSEDCGLFPETNLRPCHKDTGTCLEGCVHDRHGDHCDQLCSQNCISTTCHQRNGGCTIGCIEGYSGYFCNTSTGPQIQTTASKTNGIIVRTLGIIIGILATTVFCLALRQCVLYRQRIAAQRGSQLEAVMVSATGHVSLPTLEYQGLHRYNELHDEDMDPEFPGRNQMESGMVTDAGHVSTHEYQVIHRYYEIHDDDVDPECHGEKIETATLALEEYSPVSSDVGDREESELATPGLDEDFPVSSDVGDGEESELATPALAEAFPVSSDVGDGEVATSGTSAEDHSLYIQPIRDVFADDPTTVVTYLSPREDSQ